MTPFLEGFLGETQGIVVKIHNFTPMTGQFQRPNPHRDRLRWSRLPRGSGGRSGPRGRSRERRGRGGGGAGGTCRCGSRYLEDGRYGVEEKRSPNSEQSQDVDFNLELTGMQQSWLLNSLQNPNIYVWTEKVVSLQAQRLAASICVKIASLIYWWSNCFKQISWLLGTWRDPLHAAPAEACSFAGFKNGA